MLHNHRFNTKYYVILTKENPARACSHSRPPPPCCVTVRVRAACTAAASIAAFAAAGLAVVLIAGFVGHKSLTAARTCNTGMRTAVAWSPPAPEHRSASVSLKSKLAATGKLGGSSNYVAKYKDDDDNVHGTDADSHTGGNGVDSCGMSGRREQLQGGRYAYGTLVGDAGGACASPRDALLHCHHVRQWQQTRERSPPRKAKPARNAHGSTQHLQQYVDAYHHRQLPATPRLLAFAEEELSLSQLDCTHQTRPPSPPPEAPPSLRMQLPHNRWYAPTENSATRAGYMC